MSSSDSILHLLQFLWIVQINRDSTNYIVEEYKRLRQRDQSGAARSAWRITVRQLESMIRLSEAISRMYCQDEVCDGFCKYLGDK